VVLSLLLAATLALVVLAGCMVGLVRLVAEVLMRGRLGGLAGLSLPAKRTVLIVVP